MKNTAQCTTQNTYNNADIDSTRQVGSFQALQLQSKKLLRQCTAIQTMMQDNRENRAEAQHNLIQFGRRLTHTATDQAFVTTGTAQLLKMRQQIADLEQKHVHLHQEFIALQAQIRQVVRFQRRRLEETIRKTRNAGVGKKGHATSTHLLPGEITNCTSLFLGDFEASDQKKCA